MLVLCLDEHPRGGLPAFAALVRSVGAIEDVVHLGAVAR
jgi:hypothetical protein